MGLNRGLGGIVIMFGHIIGSMAASRKLAAAGGGGWDLSTTSYDSVSFDTEGSASNNTGLFFKSDGTRMWTTYNDYIYQYTLSTPWDLSTASYDSVSIESGQSARQIFFKSDGSKMYTCSMSTIYQYTLSTPWDLSTASYDSVSFSLSSQTTRSYGLSFKSDGSKMYAISDTGKTVYQYTLSTPWDVSTASYDSVSAYIGASAVGYVAGLFIKSDGSKMYVTTYMDSVVYQYTLSTPWDLSTASYDSVSFNVETEITTGNIFNLFFKTDGTKMYIKGDDYVYQCSLA